MSFLYLVWSNLKRRKLRSVLTVMSVFIAFLLFGYLSAIKEAFSAGVSVAGADRLVVRHKVSLIQLLPVSYLDRIRATPGVQAAAHSTWFGGVYQEPENFFAQIPVIGDDFLPLFPEFEIKPEELAKWKETRIGAIVGRTIAEKFNWKLGDRIPIKATIWRPKDGTDVWEFEVSAIYDGNKDGVDTSQFFFHYDYFDERRSAGEGLVGWYTVQVADPDNAEEVARLLDDQFANSFSETKTETEKAFVQGFAKQMGDIGTIMIAILSAVFFTILLVAGNTMGQAVRERTEELGVLKAMGFGNGQVMSFVLAESCLLAVLGGGAGLIVASFLISKGDPTNGAFPVFYFPTFDLLIGIALVFVLGLAAGVLPAIQAMNLRIADALRRN